MKKKYLIGVFKMKVKISLLFVNKKCRLQHSMILSQFKGISQIK
jgi:hypothetical protein